METYVTFSFAGHITRFLLDEDVDVNKRDRFGKTPMYYALGSFNERATKDKIWPLLKAGAKLDIPENDTTFHHWLPCYSKIRCITELILQKYPAINCSYSYICDAMKTLLTGWLRSNRPEEDKWLYLQLTLKHICDYFYVNTESYQLLNLFYHLLRSISINLNIECKLLACDYSEFNLLEKVFSCAEVCDFFRLKRIKNDGVPKEAAEKYMQHCSPISLESDVL